MSDAPRRRPGPCRRKPHARREFRWTGTTAFRRARRIVVKIGTSSLTLPDGSLDVSRIEDLSRQAARLARRGYEQVLVSSGAIGVGARRLGIERRPRTMPEKQAAAAVGQGLLMQAYERAFFDQGLVVAQVLLTGEDIADRRRHLNSRNTMLKLLELGAVPVVNENDTVAVDEIRLGDNDTLSALVATLIDADLLVILSDVDGLYSVDPRKAPDARLVDVVGEITPELWKAAGGAGSPFGTGGMATKLEAARIVTAAGIPMFLTRGSRPAVLERVVAGDAVGTLFLPRPRPLTARQRWLAFHQRPRGLVQVDPGAVRALLEQGKSLLPAGVVSVDGRFQEGDLVRVCDAQGREVARGLVNYSSDDLRRIQGVHTSDIARVLGRKDYDEVIHRDNLVVSV
ncbi:MAG: glutamate 5-kinase [Firmicutes bacterium]|nr:glutamate 5-kinase [Bacillota bacterium]